MIASQRLISDLICSAFLLILLGYSNGAVCQELTKEYVAIGFYNLGEKPMSSPGFNDQQSVTKRKTKSPKESALRISKIASVLANIGKEKTEGFTLFGIAGLEDSILVESLLGHTLIKDRNLNYIYHESEYSEGAIGVIYDADEFIIDSINPYNVKIKKNIVQKEDIHGGDILLISGELDSEKIHFSLNHWTGGENVKLSEKLRIESAEVNRRILDSLVQDDPFSKFIIMGDLTDEPYEYSLVKTLEVKEHVEEVDSTQFYSPMIELYQDLQNSSAYHKARIRLGQFVVNHSLINNKVPGLEFDEVQLYEAQSSKRKSSTRRPSRNLNHFMAGKRTNLPVFIYLSKSKSIVD